MNIGNFTLPTDLILAPMAGYSDVGFRALCRLYGAGVTYSEMVSAKGLHYGNDNTHALLAMGEGEYPRAVQIFGSDASIMSESASALDCEIIDINMGCPVPKIVKNGDGSALQRNPTLAYDVVKSVADAIRKQGKVLSVKFRKGIDGGVPCDDFARILESAGADMLTVHGRTREEMYSGRADRDIVGKVVRAVSIPVVGNGDVRTIDDYREYMDMGCVGVMIGRGALGHPEIFSTLRGIEVEASHRDMAMSHLEILRPYFPERYVVNAMKKHVCYYAGSGRGARAVKEKVFGATDYASLIDAIEMITT